MQGAQYAGFNPLQAQEILAGYSFDKDGWFPSNPECPNHEKGVPFSSDYADPNANGQVSCAQCFFHSTIMQSMSTECSHLHASANCSNCYSCISPAQQTNVGSPPSFACNSPFGMGLPSPVNHQGNSHVSHMDRVSYSLSPQSHLSDGSNEDLASRQRRLSLPLDYQKLTSSQLQPSPSQPPSYQISPSFSTTENSGRCFGQIKSGLTATKSFSPQDSPQPMPGNTISAVSPQSQVINYTNSFPKATTNTQNKPAPAKGKNHNTNRKRGASDECEVCGDRASGYHYNALTCEGCKGFFRRSINKKELPYKCKYGGNCEMDTYTRRKCPECRLKKCKAVGMLEECLLTEIQCRSKRRKRKPKNDAEENTKASTKTSTKSISVPQPPSPEPETNLVLNESNKTELESKSNDLTQEENLITFVGKAFKAYRANPEIVKRWASYLDKSTRSHTNLCEMATVHVQVLVEFTKKLPGFFEVRFENQISLLKGSVVEIMLLRNSRGYNLKKGIDMSELLKDTGLQEISFRNLLDFFGRVDSLNMDDTEYGLLSAIITFDSDHATAEDRAKIDDYRDKYLSALKTYSERKDPKRTQIVAKILNLITELRTLYDTHSKMVTSMREKDQLSPLLCEIWDLG